MNYLPQAIRKTRGAGLRNSGEGAREILVVARGNNAVERHHSKRRIATTLVPIFAISSTGCGQRIDDFLYSQWFGDGQRDLSRFDVAGKSDTRAINRLDVFRTCRKSRASLAVAKDDRGLTFVVGSGDVIAISRTQVGKTLNFVPKHVINSNLQLA